MGSARRGRDIYRPPGTMALDQTNPDSQPGLDGYMPNGDGVFYWQGYDLDGNALKPGTYLLELQHPDGSAASGLDYIYGQGEVKGMQFGSGGILLTITDGDTGEDHEVSLGGIISVET